MSGVLTLVCAVVLGLLPSSAAASCETGPSAVVGQSPQNAEQGIPTTLTVDASGGVDLSTCDPPTDYSYEFTTYQGSTTSGSPIDSQGGDESDTQNTYTYTFPGSGTYTVVVDVFNDANSNDGETEQDFVVAVQPAISGTITPPNGDQLLGSTAPFTAAASLGVPPYSYAWKYGSDAGFTDATGSTIGRLFANADSQTVLLNGQPFGNSDPTQTFSGNPNNTPVATPTAVQITDADGATFTTSVNSNVILPIDLNATIAPPSQTIYAGIPTTLSATTAGGVTPYSYKWSINSTTNQVGTGSSIDYTFPTAGTYTEQLQVSDSAALHYHAELTSEIVTVEAPPVIPPTNTLPSTCPTGTEQTVTFQLTQAKGCFVVNTSGTPTTYTATSTILLDNIPITPPGGTSIVLSAPSSSHPGGSISAGIGAIELTLPGNKIVNLIENKLEFGLPTLPAGQTSGEAKVISIGPAGGVSLFGFKIGGQVTINFGTDGSGNYYSTFDIELNLPAVFKSGAPSNSNPPGGVMGQVELKDTASGIDFNGLQFAIDNAYIGDIRLQNLCFSLIPGGSAYASSCSPAVVGSDSFTAPGAQLACQNTNLDPAVDTWAATASVILPTPSSTTIGVFGGGETNTSTGATDIDYFGGQGDNLNIPIAEGVTLNSLGGGICFSPLTLTADVGIGLLPVPDKGDAATIDGSLTYTAGTATTPWMLDLKGDASIFSNQIGTAELTVQQGGDFSFGVNTSFSIGSYVTLAGGLNGWVEPAQALFNIDGDVMVTVKVGILSASAEAEGVASSTGIAGCITVGSGGLSISAGAGYLWQSKQLTVMAGSCSVGSYEATQAADIASAGGGKRIAIPAGESGTALRIAGTTGPPQVRITGPGGFTLQSPANGAPLVLVKNKYLLIEDPQDKTTNVLIVHPKGGAYTIKSLDPTTNPIVDVETAHVTPSFSGHARVTGHGTQRHLKVTYKLPAGTSLTLVERGAHVVSTIAKNVRGKRCGESLCFTKTFTPGSGPGGRRTIDAELERAGLPLAPVALTTYKAPALTLPAKPAKVQLRRSGSQVTIRWSPSAGVAKYSVLAQSSVGQQSLFVLAAKCRAVRFTGIAADVGVTAKVQGMRFDGAVGRAALVALSAGKGSGGSKGKTLRGAVCAA